MGIPEEEGGIEMIFGAIMTEISQINVRHQTIDPKSSGAKCQKQIL